MRDDITTGEIPLRKAYLRALVDRIEVDDHIIRIVGDKALTGSGASCFTRNSGSLFRTEMAHPARFERVACAFGG
ncbi:MAG: hypothetical protein E5X53_09675 [Mesorhizobium sp.]|uniref:hypothetical protein n=1 Tax=Mesorhizobium sp. TaxID=1871066 RepID=UPI001223131A|nr:hypothetical protein [Mesorhizobium sp.]TIR52795.1 MAG: hypothetical protein E5X53_09675 [Mesorhizobium sp.]